MATIPFHNPNSAWKTQAFPHPWEMPCLPIHEHLSNLLAQGELRNGPDLPDEISVTGDRGIRFSSGMMDNLTAQKQSAQVMAAAIHAVLACPSLASVDSLYRLLVECRAIEVADELCALVTRDCHEKVRLAVFFSWLARSCPDREPVKIALAMLGCVRTNQYKSLLLIFGEHEEFTKFSAVALSASLPDKQASQALFELARKVHNWGRIDLVRRLAPHSDQTFQHWLVRDGFRNGIMYAYLAYIAAVEGRLLDQLSSAQAQTDQALMDGAAEIFDALIQGGPAEDMRDYAQGAEACAKWLELIDGMPVSLTWGKAASALKGFASDPEEPMVWPHSVTKAIVGYATRYLARPDMRATVLRALESGDRDNYWKAYRIAKELDIDPWPFAYHRQITWPEEQNWYHLMRTNDPNNIDRVLALALDQLPLDQVATGAGLEMGMGLLWSTHRAIDSIVQDLDRFPTKGWVIIRAALQSPVIRNRNMAIKALKGWGVENWNSAILQSVRQAIRDEPREDVRLRMESLVAPTETGTTP